MAAFAILALLCCSASGSRIQLFAARLREELSRAESPSSHDKILSSLQFETSYVSNGSILGMEVAEHIEIEEDITERPIETRNVETSPTESGSEVEAISLSSTVKRQFDFIDLQADAKATQNEVGLQEQALLTSSSAEQAVSSAGSQDDVVFLPEVDVPKAEGNGEQLTGADAGSLAELDASVVSPSVTASSDGVSDNAKAEVRQPGLGPEVEATVTLLADAGAKDQKGGISTNPVGIVQMTMHNSSGIEPHSLLQRQQQHQPDSESYARWPGFGSSTSIPENFKSFLTTVNALSEGSFGYVPHPAFCILAFGGLVAIIALLLRSWRFCLSRKLTCGLSNSATRHKCFHEGRVVYEWDQTLKDITVYLRPPQGQLANDLDIKVSSRHLRIGLKGRRCFLSEETYDVVNAEMSSWLLKRNGELQIFLRKVRRSKWPTVFLRKGTSVDRPGVQSDASSLNLSHAPI